MAEFVPGFNQLSFDPNSFAGSSQISGAMKSFNRLNFNILYGGETKALIMKNYYDIGTRLSYVILSTDDSLDPDNATELTTILEYELQENEYLVSVELYGRAPTLQVGNMHQIFTENLRTWDFYTRDNDPREVRVCFNAAKEPAVQSLTFNTYGASVGLSSFVWNDTKYPCNYIELSTTPFVLNKPSLALRYKHDNVVYTMDDAANVKTTGKQKITGLKIFAQQPEVTVEPSKDTHLITKGYFDKHMASYMGTVQKKDISLSILSQADKRNHDTYNGVYRITFSNFKAYVSDGRHLDPLYIERMDDLFSTSLTRKRVVLTLNLQDQDKPQPTSKTKEEMDAYQLQDGEFFATIISGYEFKNIYNYHFRPTSLTKHLWVDLCYFDSYAYSSNFTDEPLVTFKLVIHDSDLNISKCSLDTGTDARLSKYYAVKLSDDVAQSNLKEYKSPAAGNLEFNFSGLSKFVTIDGDQTINDIKTFKEVPKSLGETSEDTDLVTLAYVKDKFAAKASNGDVTIQLDGKFNSTWMAFSELKVLLQNGKRLEPKFLERVTVQGYTDSVLMVFGISDDPDAAVVRPANKTRQEIEKYVLGENEFMAELTYSEGLGKAIGHSYERQSCPWDSFLVNGINHGEVAPMFKLVIKGLTYELKGIKFKTGDKYNTYQYKCTMYSAFFGLNNGPSKTVETSDIQSEITLEVPNGTLVAPNKDNGYVDLASDQSINGVKTFNAAPKSLAEAVDGNDLITKDFATKNFFARENSARDFDILVKMKNDGTWVGFTQFKVFLSDGTRLDIKYLENGTAISVTRPLVAVFKTVTDSAAAITAPERKAKTFFDTYSLEAGEYKGTVSFYKVVGKFNPASADINPWNVYVGNGNANTYDGIYGLHIEQLDKGLKGVNFKFGDAVSTSYNYTCQQCGIVFTTNLGSLEVEYKGDMTDATEATIELPSNSAILGGFVTIENDQGIIGVKTFTKAPKCLASAVEDNDLVNKSYVDASFSPYAPQDWSVQISFGYTSGSFSVPDYTAFSYLKPLLVGGGRLEIKAVSSSISYIATDPINVIWKINPDADASFTEPQSMTDTNIKSYVLQKGEFRGTIIFAKHYGEATTHSTLYKPWQCYAAKAKSSGQIIFGFTVEGLTVGLKAITFLMGDCRPENNNGGEGATNNFWAYHTYMKAISNNVEQVLDFRRDYGYAITQTTKHTLELDPHKSLPYISFNQAQKELVTIGTEQTVKAVKTFDKFPKVTSIYGNLVSTKEELVHRDYIDNNVPPALRTNTITLQVNAPSSITRGQSFTVKNIKLVLKNGQCITPFIVDSAGMRDPTSPCPVIWKLVSYSDAVVAPTYKTADEINATKLSAGMYKGSYYPMKMLWNSTGSNANFTFDKFGGVANDGAGNGCDIFKVDIYGLDIPVDRIELSRGAGSGLIGGVALLIAVDGSSSTRCAYTPKETFDDGQIKESDYVISVKANRYWKLPLGAGYTTLSSDQTIDGFKSFAKSVSCEVAPTEDAHLANKKYVDDELAKLVARIAALEAANP